MADPLRFRILGEEYPLPGLNELLLTEAVIINRVTGLSLQEAAAEGNETLLIGLAAVALARGNPSWSVARVVETVERLKTDDVGVTGGDDPDPLPPANAPGTTSEPGATLDTVESSDNADESNGQPDARSE